MPELTLTLAEGMRRALAERAAGQLVKAEFYCRQILAAQPTHFDAMHLLALIEAEGGAREAALATFDRALAIDPDNVLALTNFGQALWEAGKKSLALAKYDRALSISPNFAKAHYLRATLLRSIDRRQEALDGFAAALRADPALASARFALCMAELPFIYENAAEISERRAAFGRALTSLVGSARTPKDQLELASGIGTFQPFLLAYQGLVDRELQADRKSTRLNSSHSQQSRMPSSA